MTTKDKLKKEIDRMPNDIIDKIYKFLKSLQIEKKKKTPMKTFDLGGKLDDVNIRERAYE